MDKLKKYIDSQPLTFDEFAYGCKLTPNTLRRILLGLPCYRSTASKILKYLSKKKVEDISYQDFLIAKKK